jgi:ribosomal protein S18 acetylase RimI-like enzyme
MSHTIDIVEQVVSQDPIVEQDEITISVAIPSINAAIQIRNIERSFYHPHEIPPMRKYYDSINLGLKTYYIATNTANHIIGFIAVKKETRTFKKDCYLQTSVYYDSTNELAKILHLEFENTDIAIIDSVAVLQKYQNQKICQKIFDYLHDDLPKNIPMYLMVKVLNEKAQHIYKKYGFTICTKIDYYYFSTSEDAFVMWKNFPKISSIDI